MLTAHRAASYIIGTTDENIGDNVTNLKLQKLLYYAQGFHAAMHDGEPLFGEALEAWSYGPVVPTVYREYKSCGKEALPTPSYFDREAYAPEHRELLDAVNSVYGQFSAGRLWQMSHEETPWKSTPPRQKIPLPIITEFFILLVEAGREGRVLDNHPIWPTAAFVHQRRREIVSRLDRHKAKIRSTFGRVSGDHPWVNED